MVMVALQIGAWAFGLCGRLLGVKTSCDKASQQPDADFLALFQVIVVTEGYDILKEHTVFCFFDGKLTCEMDCINLRLSYFPSENGNV